MYGVIAGMLVCFALVVIFRVDVRARWWAYRLRKRPDAPSRLYYTRLLASVGERAVPVLDDLVSDEDAGVRSFAVALLTSLKSARSFDLLEQACRDEDRDVRKSAIFGISFRESPGVVPFLVGLAGDGDEETAMLAVSRLEAINRPTALAALKRIAIEDSRPGVRAQAIQSLATGPVAETASVLIQCLEDYAVFAGRTVTERAMRETLTGASPPMAVLLDDASNASLLGFPGETNGSRAARVLRSLTGEDFGYVGGTAEMRRLAVSQWHKWLAAHSGS